MNADTHPFEADLDRLDVLEGLASLGEKARTLVAAIGAEYRKMSNSLQVAGNAAGLGDGAPGTPDRVRRMDARGTLIAELRAHVDATVKVANAAIEDILAGPAIEKVVVVATV